MPAHEALAELRARGIAIKAADGRLVIDAPKGAVTNELRSALAEHKPELLHILTADHETAPIASEQESRSISLTQPEAASQTYSEMTPSISAPVSETSFPIPTQEPGIMPGVNDEVAQLESDLMRLRTEEEARRAEVETQRLA